MVTEYYTGHHPFSVIFDIYNVSETVSVFIIRHKGGKHPNEVDIKIWSHSMDPF
jgi:hypothetical protein